MNKYAHYINVGYQKVSEMLTYEADSLEEACYQANADDQDVMIDLSTGQAYSINAGYCEECENEIEYDFTEINLIK
jgi:hypothetical protein